MSIDRMRIEEELAEALIQIENIDDNTTQKMRSDICVYMEGVMEDFIAHLYDTYENEMAEMQLEDERINDDTSWN